MRFVMRFVTTSVLLAASTVLAGPAAASEDLTGTARTALRAFIEAVRGGPDALAPLLAPEYQIMRANGTGFDRDGYLGRGVGAVSIEPDFSYEDVVVTAHDGVMVVRYLMRVKETVDGEPVKHLAPRLTVFRQIDGRWKVVAHANFGATK